MAINTNDPRVSKEGRRILIDGIPVRVWLKNRNISLSAFYCSCGKGMSITDIENKYKNNNRPLTKERTVHYMGKEWGIPELSRSELCRKDISEFTLRRRILNYNWDIKRALSEPPRAKRGCEVAYKGKVYSSVTDLCLKLGIAPGHVGNSIDYGFSLEEAIERASNIGSLTVMYMGKEIPIKDLVGHPDNIHKLSYPIIYGRIFDLGYTPEDALLYPKRKRKFKPFTYKGKQYDNKKDLCVSLGVRVADYHKLSGIDPDTPEFIELVDKFVSSSE